MVAEIKDFLDNETCDELISIAKKNLTKTTTLGEEIDGYRVAQGTFLKPIKKVVKDVVNKVSDLIKIPINRFEDLHVVEYNIGGEYKDHHDFFHENEEYYIDEMERGGQRIITAIMYLNDDFEGGETNFPSYGKKVTPKKGKLILWTNVDEYGNVDFNSLHAGLPVINGTKYIAVIWIREFEFI